MPEHDTGLYNFLNFLIFSNLFLSSHIKLHDWDISMISCELCFFKPVWVMILGFHPVWRVSTFISFGGTLRTMWAQNRPWQWARWFSIPGWFSVSSSCLLCRLNMTANDRRCCCISWRAWWRLSYKYRLSWCIILYYRFAVLFKTVHLCLQSVTNHFSLSHSAVSWYSQFPVLARSLWCSGYRFWGTGEISSCSIVYVLIL